MYIEFLKNMINYDMKSLKIMFQNKDHLHFKLFLFNMELK
jgi:hypothetical protein